jgi:hypothetical protein
MTDLSRRSLFAGLGALIAAPAIVRAASLMPVRGNTYLWFKDIPREWVVMDFRNSNSFIVGNIDRQWTECWPRIQVQPEWFETVYPIVHDA